MNTFTWETWAAAEKHVGGAGLDAAAQDLPEPFDWFLRAIDATERSDRQRLQELGVRSQRTELFTLIELALSEPGDFDPSRTRAALKRARVPNAPLPVLDLIRLACVAHNGAKPTRPKALADALESRPVLDAALMALSPKFKPYQVQELLLARSPRLTSYWAAGVAQLYAGKSVETYVAKLEPHIEPLAPDRWPDLDHPIALRRQPTRRSSAEEFEAFVADPLGVAWTASCERHVRGAGELEAPHQLAMLGALLDALHVLVHNASPIVVFPVCEACLTLAEKTPDVRQRRCLLQQLAALSLRLSWARGDTDPPLFALLGSGTSTLPPAERCEAAWALLQRSPHSVLTLDAPEQVIALALQSSAPWATELKPRLESVARALNLGKLQSALRGTPSPRRELVLGHLHALAGSALEACRLGTELFGQGRFDDAAEIVSTALNPDFFTGFEGRRERRLAPLAAQQLIRALQACKRIPPADLALRICQFCENLEHPSKHSELRSELEALLERVLERPAAKDQKDLFARLRIALALGRIDSSNAQFRAFGRWLRQPDTDQTIPAALRFCIDLVLETESAEYEADPDGLRADGTSGAPDSIGGKLAGWLQATTSWLDQHDSEEVARHALSLAQQADGPDPEELLQWQEDYSQLSGNDTWERLDELADAQLRRDNFDGAIDFSDLEFDLP